MRVVVYGAARRLGVLESEGVRDLEACIPRALGPVAGARWLRPGASLLEFIEAGAPALDLAEEAVARDRALGGELLADQRLWAPWPGRRMVCGGANHPVHMSRALTLMGHPTTPQDYAAEVRREGPRGFFKPVIAPAGPDDPIQMPGEDLLFDYEGELAVVIARPAKNLPAHDYRPFVWGLTLICDWGSRDMQWPPGFDPFNRSKVFDDCLSVGPCIVVGEDLDPDDQTVRTHVNGELRQDYSTAEFSLGFGETLAGLTRTLTLAPGDLVSAGSGPGTAMDTAERGADGAWRRERFLKPGDRVEVSSPAIGVLRARISAYSPDPAPVPQFLGQPQENPT